VDQAYYAQNPGGTAPALTGWYNGDFNYDGVINGDDYTMIDNAYNSQGSVSFAVLPATVIANNAAQVAKSSSAVSAIDSTEPFLPVEHPQSRRSSGAGEAVAASPDSATIDEMAELRKRRRKVVTLLED
jgi:hypothetical protein